MFCYAVIGVLSSFAAISLRGESGWLLYLSLLPDVCLFVALPNCIAVGRSTMCECEFLIIRRLVITFLYCNRLHVWTVENFAVLFDCTPVGRTSDSMTVLN